MACLLTWPPSTVGGPSARCMSEGQSAQHAARATRHVLGLGLMWIRGLPGARGFFLKGMCPRSHKS
eukprot:2719501-Alexandrium_andersonii.AAC.1